MIATAAATAAARTADGPTLRDVVGDAAFLAGAPRRFLMEIALQPVGHGVADHSRALRDPIGSSATPPRTSTSWRSAPRTSGMR